MSKAKQWLGPWLMGCVVGGALVGVAEARYQGAPLLYAAGLYASGWGLAGMVMLLPLLPLLRRLGWRHGAAGPLCRGSTLATGLSAMVLIRFTLWRDLLHEAPTGAAWAVVMALPISLAVMVLTWRLTAAAERRLQAWPGWPRLAATAPLLALFLLALGQQWVPPEAAPSRAAWLARPPPAQPPAARRGAILVVVDALRADALGSYGAPIHRGQPPSPHLDGLAQAGRRWTRVGAQAGWTKPAMASILSSRQVSGHGTMAKAAVLPPALPLLGDRLQALGVATGAVVTNYNLSDFFGFARGFDAFAYLPPDRYLGAPVAAGRLAAYNAYRLARERLWQQGRESRHFYRSADQVNAHAFALLDQLDSRQPFFLWLHYMEPHDPYFATDGRSWARVSEPKPALSKAGAMRAAYADEVQRVDRGLGALLAGLRQRNLLDSTLLAVTADHGEEFGDHGGFYHGTSLYEEMVRVPLILHGPGVTPGEDTGLARQLDLAPTLLRHLGGQPPASWEGRNLLAPGGASQSLATEDHQGHVLASWRAVDAAGHDLKRIRANPDNPRGLPPEALFDLRTDPGEHAPLATDDPRQALLETLLRGAPPAPAPAPAAGIVALDAAAEAELRALGYVQ